MPGLIRVVERLVGIVGVGAAMLLVPLTLATCFEVLSRYVFKAPTVWAYEIGYLLTGSHFLLGMAYTLRANEHIRIDIFSGKFSRRTHALIDIAAYCVILPLLAWITWAMWNYLATGWARNEHSGQSAMNLPVWPFRTVFFVAFLLLALQSAVEMMKAVGVLRGESPEGAPR